MDTGPATILLVEDDEGIRDVLTELLAEEGFQVLTAANGRDALSHPGLTMPPDLILLDLMMPVMNGWQFLTSRNDNPLLSRAPVVVMSAAGRGLTAVPGADAFLMKPLSVDQLLQAVRQLQRGAVGA